jgi:L-lactate dehydrogenase (cytochrome)
MIGRGWVYALAGAGEAGVRHILSQIQKEISVTLALTGLTSIRAISSDILLRENS